MTAKSRMLFAHAVALAVLALVLLSLAACDTEDPGNAGTTVELDIDRPKKTAPKAKVPAPTKQKTTGSRR
jgi:hypothetical protein